MSIVLFLPLFNPASEARRSELEECLARNVDCAQIKQIILLIDDDAVPHVESAKIKILKLDHRPTYADWVKYSYSLAEDSISIIANADIYFDASVEKLKDLLSYDPTAFVAISRYDRVAGVETLHANPHWSQDAWAFLPSAAPNPHRDKWLDFPLGIPRCDNKVAYVFAVYGHRVYNPCGQVKIVHLHETGLRTYNKRGDHQLVGGVAMVYASDDLLAPAKLEIQVWPVDATQITSVRLNNALERWSAEDRAEREAAIRPVAETVGTMKESLEPPFKIEPSLVAFDDHWQFPAITERHAYEQMRLFGRQNPEVVYVGFPWATLIDISKHNKADTARIGMLQQSLQQLATRIQGYRRVVTVCQHIHMLQFLSLFEDAGITDILWSHCPKNIARMGRESSIAIHPFPLYPVQISPPSKVTFSERPYLFSFVGAKATERHLSDVRTFIIEELKGRPQSLVIDRSIWHYNKIVYDGQVLARAAVSDKLVDASASAEFREVMGLTKFALCPSGTGPNSLRLWEAIASGVIPVVMAETYLPPCDEALWSRAVVICGEDRDSVRSLPDRLVKLASDEGGIRRRLHAGQILRQRYGRNNFVHDVLSLFEQEDVAVRRLTA
ncbi:exostosin domain-containing protein [Hansschlegelia zhihuaiae]|nr:exostosin family protein [Hansschlegelia zhihuaiae]